MLKKILVSGITIATLFGYSQSFANAQSGENFPSQPIKLVVSSAAGGGSDIIARLVAEKIAPILGGNVIVENRPGAGGSVAMGAVARAKPDGHTLVLGGVSTNVLIPLSNPNLNYDPIKDLTPIAQLGLASIVLVAAKDFPADDLKELVALAGSKSDQDSLQYASFGIGSSGHFCGEMFSILSNTKLEHVPYKTTPQIINDIMGGQIKIGFVDSATGAPMIQSGAVKAIATCPNNLPILPEVRSFEDQGMTVSKIASNAFRWAFYGPAGMSPEVVEKLSSAMRKVVEMPDVNKRLRDLGVMPEFVDGEELGKTAPLEMEAWKTIADQANIRME